MLIKVFGSAVFGVEATTITVEVNIDKGVGYHLVGLPDNAIKERNTKYKNREKQNQRIVKIGCPNKAFISNFTSEFIFDFQF